MITPKIKQALSDLRASGFGADADSIESALSASAETMPLKVGERVNRTDSRGNKLNELGRAAGTEMRWVTQDKFYDPNQPANVCTGNCTEAALASLLGLQLDQVPSFYGLVSENYWDAVFAFAESLGFDLVMNQRAMHYPGLYLAYGPSPRGCGHFVVMHDGEMVHDPHPSRAGLLSIDNTWVLIPHDPATTVQQVDTSLRVLDGWNIEQHNDGIMITPPDGPGCWVSGRECWVVALQERTLHRLCSALLTSAPTPEARLGGDA